MERKCNCCSFKWPKSFGLCCPKCGEEMQAKEETIMTQDTTKEAAINVMLNSVEGGDLYQEFPAGLVAHFANALLKEGLLRGNWQPIDTVKENSDGQPFFILRPENDVSDFVVEQVSFFEGSMFRDFENYLIDYSDAITDATHWISCDALPTPPEKEV